MMPGILPFSIELRRPQSCVAHGANQAVCSAGRNNDCQMSPSSVILPTATLSLWVSITISGIERLPGTLIQSFSNVNPDNSSGVPNYYHLHLNTISWVYLVTSRLQIYQPWSYPRVDQISHSADNNARGRTIAQHPVAAHFSSRFFLRYQMVP